MTKRHRLIFLLIALFVLIGVGRLIKGDWQFLLNDFWFTSGLLLLILLSLIDQPFFSKDSDVFLNAVTAGLSLLLVDTNDRNWIFWMFFSFVIYLIISSWLVMWLRMKPLNEENKWIQFFARFNREIGKPQTIYSAFFLWGAIKQFGYNSNGFNALFAFWLIFIIIDMPTIAKLIESILNNKENQNEINAIGKIFGVQSKNTFLVKLFKDRTEIARIFDFVEFTYSIGERSRVRKGLILDTYLLNEEQWIKVLTTKEIDDIFGGEEIYKTHSEDVVYKISTTPNTDYLERFIGIITENSIIGKIRFIYNSTTSIFDGQLLEVYVGNPRIKVLYQVIEGITKLELLENKNFSGQIIGEAIQLGTWNSEKIKFEKYGWVPSINSPVYISSKIGQSDLQANEYIVGHIPDTNYPAILDKNIAITHHTAIIGVTGTGKSIFARNLIRQFLKDNDTKVICIDFTGEYIGKLHDLNPVKTISDQKSESLFKEIDIIEKEIAGNYNKDTDRSRKSKNQVSETFREEITSFLKSKHSISIFELPDVENTSGVLTYTKTFFRILFHLAKIEHSFGKRICLVLEEAHTVVPEYNFSGVSDKVSQPLLNSIAQIALQGRKYNVGLLVIAQRTANVSKTILTQCNTIIAFQVYDKTSSDFLSNYFGQEIVNLLPNLKYRQAVAAGKAFKSNVPMVFEVPIIDEPEVVHE